MPSLHIAIPYFGAKFLQQNLGRQVPLYTIFKISNLFNERCPCQNIKHALVPYRLRFIREEAEYQRVVSISHYSSYLFSSIGF